MSTHHEVERTLDVADDAALPDLVGLPGVDHVAEPVTHRLDATYHDTERLDLVRHRTTLRRRTGGDDEGWHLKRPSADGERDELHATLGSATGPVPAPLRRAVTALTRGRALAPVVRLRTERTVHRLVAAGGAVLAEVCDDRVRAASLHAGTEHTWREWEVELVDGGTDLLAAAVDLLTGAGAEPAAVTSKLARALGGDRPAPHAAPPPPGPDDRALDLAVAAVRAVRDDLVRLDPAVRDDAPDAVHRARVATRTGRELLAAWRPVLDRGRTDPVRAELRWLGARLGVVRDLEVHRTELEALLAAHPGTAPAGLARRLRRRLDRDHRDAHRTLRRETLDGARYLALLAALDALVDEPPAAAHADDRSGDAAGLVLAAQWRRVRRRRRALDRAAPGGATEAAHELRKAAKRLRYTAEACRGVVGEPAARLGRRAAAVQDVLGAHRDRLGLQEVLADAADGATGRHGFALGRLHAAAGAEAGSGTGPADLARAWRRLDRPKVRGWLPD